MGPLVMGVRAIMLWCGVVLTACQGPPGEVAPAPGPDAAPDPTPDGALPDAAPPDAVPPDAAAPDALLPDAAQVDPDNPFGILLSEATSAMFGASYGAGRMDTDSWGVGAGAAMGDLNGDGHLDLVLARIDNPTSVYPGGPPELLINDGAGVFARTAEFSALMSGALAHSATLGDYDSDGDLDVYIGAHGVDYLLQNDGAGQFADVTAAAGVGGGGGDATVGAIFVDVNHDGLLDLYTVENTAGGATDDQTRNRLYLNAADGTFVDVSAVSLADVIGITQAVGAFDLSATGDVDLYVANDGLPGDAWLRLVALDDQGVPLYQDVAGPRGVNTLRASMGLAIADIDGDRTPDIYLSDWGDNDLYVNPAPGAPVTLATGAHGLGIDTDLFGETMISWSVRFVDLDQDGNLEVFVVTGGVTELRFCPHYHQLDWFLRRGAPGAVFDVITGKVGLPTLPFCGPSSDPINGRGGIWGDLDGDGDLDLVVTPYLEDYRAYRNDTPAANHALRVRLAGTVSSPDPIGATLQVMRTDGREEVRFRYAGGDTYSQSDSVLAVGLGSATSVDHAIVLWPSGLAQRIDTLPGFAVDSTMTVVEPSWIEVTPRVVEPTDPPAQLVYTPVDDTGAPLGPAGAGRAVTVLRSDGSTCGVADLGDGTYVAPLPHPGVPRRTVLTVVVDGAPLRPRPMINYH